MVFAISYDQIKKANHKFLSIEGVQAAGSPQLTLENPANCFEVMTGLCCQKMLMLLFLMNGHKTCEYIIVHDFKEIQSFGNIHLQGSDHKETELFSKMDLVLLLLKSD